MIRGVKRPCLTCGRPTLNGSRCPEHTKANLYRGDYTSRAKAVRATSERCHWCGEPYTEDNPCQADHVVEGDPASPLVGACRRCNASGAGGRRT